MIAVKLPVKCSPTGQARLRTQWTPVCEEWQQDGTWVGLFDVPEADLDRFDDLANEVSDGEAETVTVESEEDVPGFRMALYLFS